MGLRDFSMLKWERKFSELCMRTGLQLLPSRRFQGETPRSRASGAALRSPSSSAMASRLSCSSYERLDAVVFGHVRHWVVNPTFAVRENENGSGKGKSADVCGGILGGWPVEGKRCENKETFSFPNDFIDHLSPILPQT